jgi:hypothetical protein
MTNIRKQVDRLRAVQNAEQATGIRQNPSGLGVFYTEDGVEIGREKAMDEMRQGLPVHVPNAGAGSYLAFFDAAGVDEVEVWQLGSSVGDRVFFVRIGEPWHVAYQKNRSPYKGFEYSIDFNREFESPKEAKEIA